MTTREQVGHLLRRFGLGASKAELDFYEKLGVEGTVERLVHYEKYPLGFTLQLGKLVPVRDGRVQLNPAFVAQAWVARFLFTERPLEEKLTLFWHDHFAVSASKVTNAYMMLQYVNTLRAGANGNFRTLLENVSKDPAMMFWLDSQTNVAGKPNENFAREVMELFTVGIGHYTEKDIQEAARALTGWAWVPTRDFNRVRQDPEALSEILNTGAPLFRFVQRPGQHDNGVKTILGQSGNFDGDDVLRILLEQEACPKYLSHKLWEWFAYMDPEEKVVDHLAAVFKKNDFEIKPVLEEIAKMDEFWSKKCIRRLVKNPVDFCIPIARQLDIGTFLKPLFENPPEDAPQRPIGGLGGIYRAMSAQGMQLLFPPDVAGWDWGEKWISTSTMVERIRYADIIANPRSILVSDLGPAIVTQRGAKTAAEAADALIEICDAQISSQSRNAVIGAISANGGVEALSRPQSSAPAIQEALRVLFAAPEFHLC
ncbi:MAG: DUF1800 domain-containing protein [Armatimonadetes bacterium]|nr:MAG: DUF1800 domain-containing protein [Armatimonadota bacterium]